jgi:hypothetical protein
MINDEPSLSTRLGHSDFVIGHSGLGVEHRLAEIELQDLSLHLDRADQHPDLIGRELAWVAAGERFQVFGHGGVLIGGRLQPQGRFSPGGGQQVVVLEPADVVTDVRQQETKAGDVPRAGVGLEALNSVSKLLASHNSKRERVEKCQAGNDELPGG